MKISQFFIDTDQKIIDIAESLCHKQQRFTGVSHYYWLRLNELAWSATLAFISFEIHSAQRFLFAFVSVMFALTAIFYLPSWERKTLDRLSKGLRNPKRIDSDLLYWR